MTESEFQEFIDKEIPQSLFHVMPNDIDDVSGGKLEEVILIKILSQKPEALKYKPLSWFIETFLT